MSRINIRKNVCFPDYLLKETQEITNKLGTNFSSFVRKAMEEYIEKVKIEILKKELIEQCQNTAQLNLETCEDFKFVDGENI
ncbi:hypothetical protein KJ830_09185 [bacterium]|nr:hypothetical protein [bacterium]MBU4511201.1 hypothetical protein [bacterium]